MTFPESPGDLFPEVLRKKKLLLYAILHKFWHDEKH